jgi:hypothetical protein
VHDLSSQSALPLSYPGFFLLRFRCVTQNFRNDYKKSISVRMFLRKFGREVPIQIG